MCNRVDSSDLNYEKKAYDELGKQILLYPRAIERIKQFQYILPASK